MRVATVLMSSLMACTAAAQPCTPQWAEGFHYADLRGIPPCATTWMSESGPVLLIGGSSTISFYEGTPLTRPAMWNGHAFVPSPMELDGAVYSFAHFDLDGDGPLSPFLILGGSFTQQAGGPPGEFGGLAIWTGAALEPIGFLSGTSARVRAMCVHDDGTGAKLYVAGQFTHIDGVAAANIACWDGQAWSAVGSGASAEVLCLESHDEGAGPLLYAGGFFTSAGGVPASRIARWNGAAWSALAGTLTDSLPPVVTVLNSVDLPSTGGRALIVTGHFISVGGVEAYRIAKWQGGAWHTMGVTNNSNLSTHPDGVGVLDGPDGPQLYAQVYNAFSRWDGSAWQPIATMAEATVLATDTSTSPARLIIATNRVGPTPTGGLVAFDGNGWTLLGGVGFGLDAAAYGLVAGDIGRGHRLYATGRFDRTADSLTNGVAEWDGAAWAPIGAPPALGARSYTLAIHNNGVGNELYVGGVLHVNGSTHGVARWTGSGWVTVGQPLTGVGSGVHRLKVLDMGTGPRLYAMGQIAVQPNLWGIVRLQGDQWVVAVQVLSGACCADRVVDAEVFDFDGPGGAAPTLFIAGSFTSSTQTVRRVHSGAWVDASPPGFSQVFALKVFDDGEGPALYAHGTFAGDGPGVARLRHGQWTPVGALQGAASESAEMHVFDDGSGPALYIGGSFTGTNNQSYGLVKLQDGDWTPLASGGAGTTRSSLATFTHHGRPALFFSGSTAYLPGPLQPRMDYIGALVGCPRTCTADFDLDGDAGTDADIEAFFACLAGSCCATCLTADFNGDGDVGTDGDIESFFRVLAGGNC